MVDLQRCEFVFEVGLCERLRAAVAEHHLHEVCRGRCLSVAIRVQRCVGFAPSVTPREFHQFPGPLEVAVCDRPRLALVAWSQDRSLYIAVGPVSGPINRGSIGASLRREQRWTDDHGRLG